VLGQGRGVASFLGSRRAMTGGRLFAYRVNCTAFEGASKIL
jgi:hypothetical protein